MAITLLKIGDFFLERVVKIKQAITQGTYQVPGLQWKIGN